MAVQIIEREPLCPSRTRLRSHIASCLNCASAFDRPSQRPQGDTGLETHPSPMMATSRD